MRLLDALWSSNFTPQQLIRAMGAIRGRNAVARSLGGRIPHLSDTNAELLGDYLYHITVAHPSGEFAMNSLLEPAALFSSVGVYAREPLEGPLRSLDSSIEMTVFFGDSDWIRFNEGSAREVTDHLREERNMVANTYIIPNAGHHLYLDNVSDFVMRALKEVN